MCRLRVENPALGPMSGGYKASTTRLCCVKGLTVQLILAVTVILLIRSSEK